LTLEEVATGGELGTVGGAVAGLLGKTDSSNRTLALTTTDRVAWFHTLGTNSYLLIRYMSSKLQANGKKTSPVITLQMLGFFRIY